MSKLIAVLLFFLLVESAFPQKINKIKINDLVNIIDSTTSPIAINFWASWCKPCIEEIPYFEKEAKNFKDKNLKLILVSLDFEDDFPKHLTNFVKKNKYKSKVFWLNESNADYFCPKVDSTWNGVIPATLLINKKNNYRKFISSQIPKEKINFYFTELTSD